MIFDARLDDVPMQWAVPVVIVGAGPVGLTLARELAARTQVLIIEAGGVESEPENEALLTGDISGLPYPIATTRARQFGGSSALWAGYCAQFDAHDFAVRDWVPLSGWPFGVEAIEPYYDRAAGLLNLGSADFDARAIARCSGSKLPFDNGDVTPTVWRFGTPTQRVGESLRGEFESSSNITTLTNACVTDIRLDAEHSRVTELVIRTLNGREGRVSAELLILACGGIETARLLLNADGQVRQGIGNSSGLVGRCFMEHPHRCITPLQIVDRELLESWTGRALYDEDKQFTFCVGLSRQAQERAKVLNARAHIYRTPEMAKDAAPRVGLFMEQAPNPESRVRLSDSTDSLGMRRARLEWNLNELDWTTFERTASLIAKEFEFLGAGQMTAPIDRSVHGGETVLYSNHHLGTTRMADDKHCGVVDRDCRVHDLSNLYVLSGGVFPTASWANPTFTLLALTFRLADHLRERWIT